MFTNTRVSGGTHWDPYLTSEAKHPPPNENESQSKWKKKITITCSFQSSFHNSDMAFLMELSWIRNKPSWQCPDQSFKERKHGKTVFVAILIENCMWRVMQQQLGWRTDEFSIEEFVICLLVKSLWRWECQFQLGLSGTHQTTINRILSHPVFRNRILRYVGNFSLFAMNVGFLFREVCMMDLCVVTGVEVLQLVRRFWAERKWGKERKRKRERGREREKRRELVNEGKRERGFRDFGVFVVFVRKGCFWQLALEQIEEGSTIDPSHVIHLIRQLLPATSTEPNSESNDRPLIRELSPDCKTPNKPETQVICDATTSGVSNEQLETENGEEEEEDEVGRMSISHEENPQLMDMNEVSQGDVKARNLQIPDGGAQDLNERNVVTGEPIVGGRCDSRRAPESRGEEELREEAGCVLWDLAANQTHADFLVRPLCRKWRSFSNVHARGEGHFTSTSV